MSLLKRAGALTVLALQVADLKAQCAASWTGNTSTDWNTASNWDFCLPNGTEDAASFPSSVNTTVTLSAPITINRINFLTGANNYNISGNEFTFAGTSPQLSVASGTQTFSSNIANINDILFNIDGTLDFSGEVLPGGSGQITLTGTGTINSTSGEFIPDAFVMNSGNLMINSGAFCGEFGFPTSSINITGGNVTIDSNTSFGEQAGDFTISGGTFNNAGVFAQYVQNLSITGGSFTNTSNFANNATTIVIDGGTFNLPNAGATLGNLVTSFTINGGSFSMAGGGGTNIAQLAGTLTINGGTFNQTDSSVLGYFAGVVNISGGNFFLTNSAELVQFSNTVTISGGIFNIEGNSSVGSFASSLTIEGNPLFNITTESQIGEGAPITMSGGTVNIINNIDTQFPSSLNMSGGTLYIDPVSSWLSPIAMTGGTILNDGLITPAGPLTMEGPSTLRGTGIFAGNVSNGGTVGPGDPGSVGTLTIQGPYSQTPSGTFFTTVQTSSASLLVAQSATLNGTLNLFSLPGFIPQGQMFTILEATEGVSGTFSDVTLSGFQSLVFVQVAYPPDSVVLTFTPVLPSYIGGYNQMVLSSINQINYMLFRHLDQVKDPCATYCSHCRPNTLNFYAGPLGSVGKIKKYSDQSEGVQYNSIGGIVGFDYSLSDTSIGIEVDYQRFNGRGKGHFGKVGIDQVHANLYGSYEPLRNLSLDFLVGGGYDWVKIDRNINAVIAKGRPDASIFDALIGFQYILSDIKQSKTPSPLQFIPIASLQYISIEAKSYDESDAGIFNVHFDRRTVDSLRSLVGFKANGIITNRYFTLIPEVNLALQNELLKQKKHLGVSFPYTGQLSSLEIDSFGRNIILSGIDLNVRFNQWFGLEATYEFEGNNRYQNHFFYVGINGRY